MQAVSLPSCAADPALRARAHRSSTELDLCSIAARLGLLQRRRRVVIAKVRALAVPRAEGGPGFPLPKTPRFVKGGRLTGPLSIDAYSLWDRDAVERWFEDDLPPGEATALAVARRSAAAEEMTRRAVGLVKLAANG